MKDTFNLVFVAMLLIVFGSACSNTTNEAAVKIQSNAPVAAQTPVPSNTSANNFTNKPVKKDNLSMVKFNRLKNGMTYEQTVEIIGGEGAEVESAESGKDKFITYKWDDEKSSIVLTFKNEKLSSKKQENLK